MHRPPTGTAAELAELGLSSPRHSSKGKSSSSRASSKTDDDKRKPLGTVNEAEVPPVAATDGGSTAAVISLQGSGSLELEVVSHVLGMQSTAEGIQDGT